MLAVFSEFNSKIQSFFLPKLRQKFTKTPAKLFKNSQTQIILGIFAIKLFKVTFKKSVPVLPEKPARKACILTRLVKRGSGRRKNGKWKTLPHIHVVVEAAL